VSVLSIFNVQTKFSDSQSFRVCIGAEDECYFTNNENWPNDVIVREWVHKQRSTVDGNNHKRPNIETTSKLF